MYINQQIGKLGEDLACKYLKENKYTIIERNFNCKQGEVDIIAYDTYRNELVFLEVKTRFNLVYGRPSEAVSKVKTLYFLLHMIEKDKMISNKMIHKLRLQLDNISKCLVGWRKAI